MECGRSRRRRQTAARCSPDGRGPLSPLVCASVSLLGDIQQDSHAGQSHKQ